MGRRNCGMAFRTDIAANVPFGGRWRFGGPPTLAGDTISRGVRQFIRGRVLLAGSDEQSSQTEPTYYRHPNP
ncbi:hypothetical protein SBA5_1380001 [Candidatus Sulfotelmatomonas gaucii]|uniref:Uncharacterized protein n=1 Tax=Candidatus Sulfuritelmatomonas gaucii TaxID=2043161 RepID=A0A2N9L4G7_9BACT|nr:hypothetical protein SBA5_1380001 [Candidatus Sulfotelmatomonas gaucii]